METCNFDSKYVFSCRCIFSYARVCILREGNNGDIYTIWFSLVRVCEGIVVHVEPVDIVVYVFVYYVFCRNDILSLTASPAKPGSSFALLLSVARLHAAWAPSSSSWSQLRQEQIFVCVVILVLQVKCKVRTCPSPIPSSFHSAAVPDTR